MKKEVVKQVVSVEMPTDVAETFTELEQPAEEVVDVPAVTETANDLPIETPVDSPVETQDFYSEEEVKDMTNAISFYIAQNDAESFAKTVNSILEDAHYGSKTLFDIVAKISGSGVNVSKALKDSSGKIGNSEFPEVLRQRGLTERALYWSFIVLHGENALVELVDFATKVTEKYGVPFAVTKTKLEAVKAKCNTRTDEQNKKTYESGLTALELIFDDEKFSIAKEKAKADYEATSVVTESQKSPKKSAKPVVVAVTRPVVEETADMVEIDSPFAPEGSEELNIDFGDL